MEVLLAKSAGFCFGVKNAVEAVNKAIEDHNDCHIYTYGPIIHNETVTNELAQKGVRVIDDREQLQAIDDDKAVIVIRSHGISREILEIMEEKAHILIDATCPFVKRIHDLVRDKSREGFNIVILGSRDHPEVQGIMGWCEGPVSVIESYSDAENYTPENDKSLFVVAQTTFNHKKFQELVAIFEKKGYNSTVANTICHATYERQEEAADIASRVDAMFVIGGRESSNTAKLYDICAGLCQNTSFLQTAADIPDSLPEGTERVGITAGASTPQFIIEEVYQHVGINF